MHLGTHHGCGCIEQHTHLAHAAVRHRFSGGFVVATALQSRDQAFETVLLLNTLTSETPSLTYDDSNLLYQEVMKDYAHESSKFKKFQAVKKNRYFNALQVKFSYAITCHKSQGGQWNTVFIEQPYLPNGIDRDYLRWLYTAVTRAKEKLYLIGFNDDFFQLD